MTNEPVVEADRPPEQPVSGGKTSPPVADRRRAATSKPPIVPPKIESAPEQLTFWIILVILFLVSAFAAYLLWAKLTGSMLWP